MSQTLEFSLALSVAVVAGFLGLIFLFSDPTGDMSARAFWYTVHFFIPGLLIGVSFPRVWYMAGVIAWPSVGAALGTLVFSVFRLVGPIPDYPDVQVVVHDGSIDVNPEVLQLTDSLEFFSLHLRNEGSSAHEVVLISPTRGKTLRLWRGILLELPLWARSTEGGQPFSLPD